MAYIGRTPTNAALTASDLADGIVTTAKIDADAVTSAKIADNAVVTAAINADAVTDAKIADDVVGTEHLTANEVDTTALGADAVTGAQLADDAVNSEHYTDGSIDTAHIADGQVTKAKLADQVDIFAGTSLTAADLGSGIHVRTADSSASVLAGADEIIAEGSGDSGISILSGTSGTGTIAFGDSGDNDIGMIQYLHAQNSFAFTNNAGLKLQIDSAGEISTGSSDGTLVIQGGASYPGAQLSLSGGIASTDPGTFKFLADSGSDTSPAERMRLTDSGTLRLLHGNFGNTPSSSNKGFEFRANGSQGGTLDCAITDTSNHTIINFDNGNGGVGTIQMNGSATAYNTSSDYRLKENVNYDFDATSRLKQLKPARFNFKADADTTVDGFIAHEVSSIVPEAISGKKDAVKVWKDGEELPEGVSIGDNKLDADGNTIMDIQGIDQSKLVPLLVKTIQELEARITELENA